jgi:hypothetical protein
MKETAMNRNRSIDRQPTEALAQEVSDALAGRRPAVPAASASMNRPSVLGAARPSSGLLADFAPDAPIVREYRYAMVNRPPGYGTVPKGMIRTEERPREGEEHHETARNGIAVYDRPLTDEETRAYEMAPMPGGDDRLVIARAVASDMSDYAGGYLEAAKEDPRSFAEDVAHRLRDVSKGYRPSVGDMATFARMVEESLMEISLSVDVNLPNLADEDDLDKLLLETLQAQGRFAETTGLDGDPADPRRDYYVVWASKDACEVFKKGASGIVPGTGEAVNENELVARVAVSYTEDQIAISLHEERMQDPVFRTILGWPKNDPDLPSSFGEDEARLKHYDLDDPNRARE